MTTNAAAKSDYNPFSVLGDALESAAETFEEVTVNAKDSAKKAAGTTKRVISKGAYKTAYGISYGIVFTGVFLKELLPEQNAFRRGLEEGASAAVEKRVTIRKIKIEKAEAAKNKARTSDTEEKQAA